MKSIEVWYLVRRINPCHVVELEQSVGEWQNTRWNYSIWLCITSVTLPYFNNTWIQHSILDKNLISCGKHKASSCSDCPKGRGEAWCSGACEWRNNRCQDKGILSFTSFVMTIFVPSGLRYTWKILIDFVNI